MPTVGTLRDWKVHARKTIVSAANLGMKTMKWARSAELKGVTFEDLAIQDDEFIDVELKLAEAVMRIVKDPDLRRDMNFREEELLLVDSMLGGRQSLWLLYQHLAVDSEMTQLHDFDDLFEITCKGEEGNGTCDLCTF